MHSFTEENYLKAIYKLQESSGEVVATSALAHALGVHAPSVTDMLKRMAQKKLVSYQKSKGFRLTEKGRQVAIRIIRNHRLWEVFLVDKLGFRWDEVHDLAEQLEHIQSDALINKLDDYLGHPKSDPHGDPIPSAKGEVSYVQRSLLSEVEKGKTCQVVGVKDSSAIFLQYLQQQQVGIGTKVKVIDKIAFDGSLVINIKKSNVTVSKKFADNVLVTNSR